MGDITTQEIPNLPKDITSSNFGKMNKEARYSIWNALEKNGKLIEE